METEAPWLLTKRQHRLVNTLRGVPDAQRCHGPAHFRLPLSVAEDAAGRLEQRLTGAVRLQQHRRTACFLQHPGVFLLMVLVT